MPCFAYGFKWEKFKTIPLEITDKPVGQMFSEFLGPDGKSKLIVQFNNSDKINPYKLYFFKDKKYSFIEQYQEIRKVTWDKNTKKV